MQLETNNDENYYNLIKEKISKKIPLSKEELDYHHNKIKEENLFAEKLQQKSVENRLSIKNEIENKYANWILSKEILPHINWYLKSLNTDQNNISQLEIGDYIEFIDPAKSFNDKDEYIGSISTQIKSLSNNCIYLALSNNEQFLLGENAKIIRYKKYNWHGLEPKKEKNFLQKILTIIITHFSIFNILSILIILILLTLVIFKS